VRLKTFGGLWIDDAALAAESTPRPRALALLAILAVAGPKGTSRDRVLGVLWPESETERARHALSQTIYSLRKDLRMDVVLSTPDLRLDTTLISSDVAELRAAVRASDWRAAAALYVGPFLEGFYLADAPEFERWVESERASLAADAVRAIEHLAKDDLAAGRTSEAAECYRRLTRLDPVNPRFAIAYMEAMATIGNRTEALAHGKAYTELVRREFDAAPDRDVQRLINRLRDTERSDAAVATPPAARPVVATPVSAPATAESSEPTAVVAPTSQARLRFAHRRLIAAVGAGMLLIAALITWAARRPEGALPVVAVGRIRDLGSPDSVGLSGVLREMLATNLGSVSELQVIANSRILELTPRDADTSRSIVTDAARRAGATEIIEGELIPLADRSLRLNIRRVDMARGIVRGAYEITGRDRIALFDSATALIAHDFRLAAPTRSLADVSTRSPLAYRLYEEGLRAFYQSDAATANKLFRSALREDSSFAMAAYYAWRSAAVVGDTNEIPLAKLSLSLSSRASERDGLLIRTHVGFGYYDLQARPAAETLATRYPRDPEALIRAAEVIQDLSRATTLLGRSISLDSSSGTRAAPICRLCEALSILVFRYQWADSSAAAERTLLRWSAFRPTDPTPWVELGDLYMSLGRRADAVAAERRAEALGMRGGHAPLDNLISAIRAEDYDAADTACDAELANADASSFVSVRWYCAILLRMEGRYREALALVREGRLPHSAMIRRGAPEDPTTEAILDFEMGRARLAADEFRALESAPKDTSRVPPGTRAREMAWHLTLSATAAVADGDTLRARALVDSIETIGQQSLFPRDPQLHHFIRGLLLERANDTVSAVREFRAAIVSPTFGYTRANYELGHALRTLKRPAEAILVVRAALHGGIEGSNLYITRPELHELLAQLFDLTGQRDSAAAHYAIVDRAWRSSDPFLSARHDAAHRWLAGSRRSAGRAH
jgi:DNA-binding SARP family transcriptional activator/TolB-like protein